LSAILQCIQCGCDVKVRGKRVETFKFCSFACRSVWRALYWSGENNPQWTGGEREKTCQHCGQVFRHKPDSTVTTFRKQKFCSKPCADAGGIRYSGPQNGNWNGDPRRNHRPSKHAAWARAVISRDGGKCRHCGSADTELHAHHVKSYKTHPELRFDLDNGLSLCAPCHWQVHSKIANGVNSGKTAAGKAGGNPEPSFGRKPIEGATTRGRAYRRWEGSCENCGKFLSKRWSDVAGKAHIFCSKQCMGRHRYETRTGFHKTKSPIHGDNASTSAPRPLQGGDIVWTHVKA